jgi:hypothetical protein
MGNHEVNCELCGRDLRGLSGGHAPGCSDEKERQHRYSLWEKAKKRPAGDEK